MNSIFKLLAPVLILEFFLGQMVWAQISDDEMASISVPDVVQTSIGKLNYRDGAPTQETAQKLYDYVDLMRGVQAVVDNHGAVSMYSLRRGFQSLGVINTNQILIHEKPVDANSLYQVANSQTLYMQSFLDLKTDGPTVIEVAPQTLGFLNDLWQIHVADLGISGSDKGKGGKYLILPPGYEGDIPEGYFVVRSTTYAVWYLGRGFLTNGNPEPSLSNIKANLRIYPLAKSDNPPATEFVDVSGIPMNTITPNNFRFFEDLNAVIQAEPIESLDAERRGVLKSIGIEKGKPFNPDARMKGILSDAVEIGHGYFRTLLWQPRDEVNALYKGSDSHWMEGFPNRNTTFIENGAMELDARLRLYGVGIGVSPAMSSLNPGRGSDYALLFDDSKGEAFDGSKTYKLRLPPEIPVANFWSIIVYDNQTRSFLPTSQPGSTLSSLSENIKQNADGSTDIYFGPTPPKGKEGNWVETVVGKGWFICLRMYGPTEKWIDQSWRPGEMELLE